MYGAALLERDAELAALAQAVAALRDQRSGGVVLIEGALGIGKTALLEAAVSPPATEGVQLLRARGSELESVLAFGGARQLFAGAVLAVGKRDRELLFEGPAGLARPVLGLQPAGTTALGALFADCSASSAAPSDRTGRIVGAGAAERSGVIPWDQARTPLKPDPVGSGLLTNCQTSTFGRAD